MTKLDGLKMAYWITFAMVIGAFYVGLRSEEYKLEYTLIAMALWGISYGLNKLIAKEKLKD